MDVALLVPVKSFAAAKQRLAPVLDESGRGALAAWMAEQVLAAAAGVAQPVVVCDSPDVASWAHGLDTMVINSPDTGLNGAVANAIGALAAHGFEHVIVAHSDLPAAESFAEVYIAGTVVVVPDRRHDGTNVLSIPMSVAVRLVPQYGGGSFTRHVDQLVALGTTPQVIDHPRLAVDVDTPDDFFHPMIQELLPEWLQTNRANPR